MLIFSDLLSHCITHIHSDVALLTCSLQVHLCHVFGKFTGAGRYWPLSWDVGHCVPAACAITVDEVWIRRLHIHHLPMTSALITPARGRRGCQMAMEVLQEANKSLCCLLSKPWVYFFPLYPVHFYFGIANKTCKILVSKWKITKNNQNGEKKQLLRNNSTVEGSPRGN